LFKMAQRLRAFLSSSLLVVNELTIAVKESWIQ